jgi:16S rRNA processing protein RimM
VRGKVVVYPYHDQGSCLEVNRHIRAGKDEEGAFASPPLTVSSIRRKSPETLIISFEEISTADGARGLKGAELFVERSDVPVARDEVLVADFPGMHVFEGDARVGTVKRTYPTPAGEVLVIDTGEGLVDFPLRDEYLELIDVEGNTLKVNGFSDFLDLRYFERRKKNS